MMQKKSYILLIISILGAGKMLAQKVMQIAPTNKAEKAGWRIVFQDEFDGEKLNVEKWQPQETPHGDESQHYKNDEKNVFLKNGLLHLRALREPFKNYAFTSGEVFSKKEFGQGTLCEVRCKIPKGKSLWPAFWFWRGLHGDSSYQEIDVFEFWCADTRRFSVTNHYFDAKKKKMTYDYKWIKPENTEGVRLDMSENFHTYAVYWDEKGIKVLFDNILVVQLKKRVPKNPFPVILNLALEGGKNTPTAEMTFPVDFLVDYVRVYKRE